MTTAPSLAGPIVQTIFAFRMVQFFWLDKMWPAHHLVRERQILHQAPRSTIGSF